ncbi:hypothetical protein pEaSNUABM29_00054 [Erwinia phage pEa_SNUABM_29]|nr:hypothetical protein pEaSNUABM29_00054 [Erwinia phage pEa_SNUABM_29]
MLKSVSFDAPDFAGKSTLAKLVCAMLRAAGINAVVVNHPTNTTEAGVRARSLVVQHASHERIAKAMCEDFLHTLENVVPEYDVVIFDRFCLSTIVYQGVEGKGEVFRSKVADHPNAPQLYVAMDVDFETATERFRKRVEAQGKNWDDEVLTAKYLRDNRSWEALRDSYRFAHQIITEGGEKFPLMNVVSDDDVALTAARIVERILAG